MENHDILDNLQSSVVSVERNIMALDFQWPCSWMRSWSTLAHSGAVAPPECRDRLSISRGSMLSVMFCCNLTVTMPACGASAMHLAWTNLALLLTQGCVRLTVVLFVALQESDWGLHRTGAGVPSHSIANDFALHTVLLCGEGESNQGGIVQFHSPCCIMCHYVGPLAECCVLQAKGRVFGAK